MTISEPLRGLDFYLGEDIVTVHTFFISDESAHDPTESESQPEIYPESQTGIIPESQTEIEPESAPESKFEIEPDN